MKRRLLLILLLSAAMLLSACGTDAPVDDAQTVLPEDAEQADTNEPANAPDTATEPDGQADLDTGTDQNEQSEQNSPDANTSLDENGRPITYLDDVLGFEGYAVTTVAIGDEWMSADYYATVDGADVLVADSFGFGNDAYTKTVAYDLDGDGRSELVSLCTYGGDGAERVYLFRWNGTASEVGTPDWSKAGVDLDMVGVMQMQESYDTARGVVALYYHGNWEGDEYRTVELPLTMESFLWEAYERDER